MALTKGEGPVGGLQVIRGVVRPPRGAESLLRRSLRTCRRLRAFRWPVSLEASLLDIRFSSGASLRPRASGGRDAYRRPGSRKEDSRERPTGLSMSILGAAVGSKPSEGTAEQPGSLPINTKIIVNKIFVMKNLQLSFALVLSGSAHLFNVLLSLLVLELDRRMPS